MLHITPLHTAAGLATDEHPPLAITRRKSRVVVMELSRKSTVVQLTLITLKKITCKVIKGWFVKKNLFFLNKNINQQFKAQNTLKNIKIVFIFILYYNTFSKQQ